jgi:hypothetical protein
VLSFFSVPPFKRQAAGPLTENLPHVFLGGPNRAASCADRVAAAFAGDPVIHGIDPLLERPSPRGIQRRLFSRVLDWAAWAVEFFLAAPLLVARSGTKGATFA